jgi:hypothetical protein
MESYSAGRAGSVSDRSAPVADPPRRSTGPSKGQAKSKTNHGYNKTVFCDEYVASTPDMLATGEFLERRGQRRQSMRVKSLQACRRRLQA